MIQINDTVVPTYPWENGWGGGGRGAGQLDLEAIFSEGFAMSWHAVSHGLAPRTGVVTDACRHGSCDPLVNGTGEKKRFPKPQL